MSDRTVLYNGQAVDLSRIPSVKIEQLLLRSAEAVKNGARISSFFGYKDESDAFHLMMLLAWDAEGSLQVIKAPVSGSCPSLTPDCPQAHLFEREIFEQWGVKPEGHPWLKPVRFHGTGSGERPLPGVTDMFRMQGTEVHEVAVGPVHAGVIEPGHFRFQCHGETVYHLEISLGYQHRGIEKMLRGGPDKRALSILETTAGDTTVGHALAYSRAVEGLSGIDFDLPARAESLRGIALELERLANHTGDLGALAGDIGFLPTSSYCGRLRGDFLNMTAMICGNRFSRGLIRPGGTGYDLNAQTVDQMIKRLTSAMKDAEGAIKLLWDDAMVLGRFEGTGPVTPQDAVALGLVGPPARACGLTRDVRQDFPFSIYRFSGVSVSTFNSGDVFARAYVRWLEMQRSADFILSQLKSLPAGAVRVDPKPLRPSQIVASLTEGWRGEIVHVAMTDPKGRFLAYKITDPSFHNWIGLAMALRDQGISDFPLCNKSFNLSYCGHDL